MKFLAKASLLPVALAASLANAQTVPQFAPQQSSGWTSGSSSRAVDDGAQYDMARVIRVQRVSGPVAGAATTRNGQRCYTDGGGYYPNDGYANGSYGNVPYGNGAYGNGYGYPGNTYGNRGYNNGYGYPGNGYGQPQGNGTGRMISGILGSVVGAVVGSQVGGGSGRYIGSAVGSVLGGVAGTGVYDNVQRNRQPRPQVTVCDPVPAGSDPRDYGQNGGTWYDVTYEYRGRTYTDRLPYDPGRELRVRVDVRPI